MAASTSAQGRRRKSRGKEGKVSGNEGTLAAGLGGKDERGRVRKRCSLEIKVHKLRDSEGEDERSIR